MYKLFNFLEKHVEKANVYTFFLLKKTYDPRRSTDHITSIVLKGEYQFK